MSARNPNAQWWALLLAAAIVILALSAMLARELQPIPMHDLRLADGERLKCVSYAPYRLPGQTPLTESMRIPREQIEADLKALAAITECVRIYSVTQGLEHVPQAARAAGLKVLLGSWVGADPARNAAQLELAIRLANEHRDVVRALVVGNEVLLRRERSPAQLRELIEYARARVEVPVTYADVWEFWVQNRELAASVDWVTVHILPFWEDHPVAIDDAVEHVGEVFTHVATQFDKPLMIGETGWPSEGRQREGSLPSLVNQARYVREFIHMAHDKGWDYNLIEAIDQPWKRRLEGTVGGYWGMLDTALQPKFPLAGPVRERHSPTAPLAAALLGALLCAALGARTAEPGLRLPSLAGLGAATGLIMALQWEHALIAYRDMREWLVLGGVTAAAALAALLHARVHSFGGLPPAHAAWRQLRRGAVATAAVLGLLRGVLLFAAAVAALLLFADPRYRDFPTLLYLTPALLFGTAGWFGPAAWGREERVCAAVLAGAAIGRWLMEPANTQAVAWLLVGLWLGGPYLLRTRNEHQQG